MPSKVSASAHHAAASAICLLSLISLLSSTVNAFGPLQKSSPAPARSSNVGVSLYIDPILGETAVSPNTPQTNSGTTSPDGTTESAATAATAAATAAAPPKPSRRRRRQEPQTAHIIPANSPAEFEHIVRSEKDKLVVVRFHSPYCPACKSISVSYDKLAKINAPQIKFVDVSVTDRNDLIPYGLDVPATPYAMLWHPDAGLVEESTIPRRQFSKFKRILKWYAKGECELPEEFFTNPHNEYDMENLIL